MCFGYTIAHHGRQGLLAIACLALVVWSIAPSASHVPRVIETLQEHAQMIATHGHSHGLEEDLLWAMHGHSHDAADHDHSQAVLLPSRQAHSHIATKADWRGLSVEQGSPPHFRLDRPPRA